MRPLEITGTYGRIPYFFLGRDRILGLFHIRVAHYAFLFTDTGEINSFGADQNDGESEKREDFEYFDNIYYDDDILRKAIKNIKSTKNWDYEDKDYSLRSNNCQHYIDAVTKEYRKLIDALPEQEKKCLEERKKLIEEYWRTHITMRDARSIWKAQNKE